MNINNTRKVLSFIKNMLDTTKPTFSQTHFDEKKPIFYENTEKFFERVSPEECGIESGYIHSFLNELYRKNNIVLQSIMLMRKEKVFFEADVELPYSHYPKLTFSECKSIVALAIGSLVTYGKLRLSEKIVDIFADKITPMGKIRLKGLTVRHLLTMSSGILFNEFESLTTSDWIYEFLNSDTVGEFGEKFHYNSLNTFLLSAIIIERTGMSLSEYLDSTIFSALKIKDYYWEKCPNGFEKGGWGLYILREDLAKLGLLVMQKGIWNGKRLISEKYIEDATKTQIETPMEYGDYNYGFQIWTGRENDIFLFNGIFGQNLLGFKNNEILIIANCGNKDFFQKSDFFEICHRYFSNQFPEIIEKNEKAFSELEKFKSSLRSKRPITSFLYNKKHERHLEDDLSRIDGKAFEFFGKNTVSTGFSPLLLQLIQSNFTKGLEKVSFSKNDRELDITFYESDEGYIIKVGFDQAKKSIVTIHNEPYTVMSTGEFSTNEDGIPILVLEIHFIETPYTRTVKFYFSDECYAVFSETPGIDIAQRPQILLNLLEKNGQKIENLFEKFDGDYLGIKLENAFSPKIFMKKFSFSDESENTEHNKSHIKRTENPSFISDTP